MKSLSARGRQVLSTGLILLVAAVGVALVVAGFATQQVAPQPAAAVVGQVPDAEPTPAVTVGSNPSARSTPSSDLSRSKRGGARSNAKSKRPAALGPSRPVHLKIAALDIDADLVTVGLTADGSIAVPKGRTIDQPAWFDQSPTPGQYGPSVIVGHIDTVRGPSVFFRLGALKPGDAIVITRADHRTATFVVDGLKQYPQRNAIPALPVFGGDNAVPGIRLITCSNFDHSTGHYRGNLVVFGHLTSTGKA